MTELTDGVSARVVRIGDLVCKQPYAQLRVSDTWLADVERVTAEAAALHRFSEVAPAFVAFDEGNHMLVQQFVDGTNWKRLLLGGVFEPATAVEAGRLLTLVHQEDPATFGPDSRYASADRLHQLRLDPYFGYAAVQLPHLASSLQAVSDYLSHTHQVVVHGDYSPKNLLVDPANPQIVRVLDWEVVHAGAPEFDLAFLVSHLRAKAAHMPDRAHELRNLEDKFLGAYRLPFDVQWYGRILGALLIARVYGRSPLSYLNQSAQSTVYEQGVRLLNAPPSSTSTPTGGTHD
ncbi:phosphotransferase family protein [Prescottella subtropica]|uniref:phosphotransferase family protein n=1 Tax=Prescottella subtropica TaxID=2545757 RepID=UPI0013867559|nr:phosphotransferase [Prescottella subtropica]